MDLPAVLLKLASPLKLPSLPWALDTLAPVKERKGQHDLEPSTDYFRSCRDEDLCQYLHSSKRDIGCSRENLDGLELCFCFAILESFRLFSAGMYESTIRFFLFVLQGLSSKFISTFFKTEVCLQVASTFAL